MNQPDDDMLRHLSVLYQRMRRHMDQLLAGQSASLARVKLLMYIAGECGAARAADIADLFGQAPRTVTEALDALERDGLIQRTPDPDDRRVKRLAITEAGATAVAAAEPIRRKFVEDLFRVLDVDERAQFDAMLVKLIGALDQP